MGAVRNVFVVVVVLTAACAPISHRTSSTERVISQTRSVSSPASVRYAANVTSDETGFDITVTGTGSCRESFVESVEQRATIDKRVNRVIYGAEWFFAVAFGAAGGLVLADPSVIEDQPYPGSTRFVTPAHAEVIGYSAVGLGAFALLSAAVDSFAKRDKHPSRGIKERTRVGGEAPCEVAPSVAGVAIALAGKNSSIKLGTTSESGALRVEWEAIPAALIEGANDTPLGTVLIADTPAAQVELQPVWQREVARAWATAEAAATIDGWLAQRTAYPSFKVDELQAALAAAADAEFQSTVEASLASGNVVATAELLDRWRELAPNSVALAESLASLTRAVEKESLEETIVAFRAAVTAPPTDENQISSIEQAAAILAQIRAVAPGDERLPTLEDDYAAARAERVAWLVEQSEQKLKANSFAEARASAEQARLLEASSGPAQTALLAANKALARHLAGRARAELERGEIETASATLDEADETLRGDRVVKETRRALDARVKQLERAAADAIKKEERALAQTAAKEERARLAAEKAESRRLAAEEKARVAQEKRLRRDEDKRLKAVADAAKRETERKSIEEERSRRAVEAKLKEEERKVAAQAAAATKEAARVLREQQAEAARVAAREARAARAAEKKRAEESAQLAAKERKRAKEEAREQRELALSVERQRAAELQKSKDAAAALAAARTNYSASLSARAPGSRSHKGAWLSSTKQLLLSLGESGRGTLSTVNAAGAIAQTVDVSWSIRGGELTVGAGMAGTIRGVANLETASQMEWGGWHWDRLTMGPVLRR